MDKGIFVTATFPDPEPGGSITRLKRHLQGLLKQASWEPGCPETWVGETMVSDAWLLILETDLTPICAQRLVAAQQT